MFTRYSLLDDFRFHVFATFTLDTRLHPSKRISMKRQSSIFSLEKCIFQIEFFKVGINHMRFRNERIEQLLFLHNEIENTNKNTFSLAFLF